MSARARRLLAEQLREHLDPERVDDSYGSLDLVFAEEPVPLETFVGDKAFLYNPPLAPEQYLFVRHFEQIFLPELYPLMVEEFGEYWDPVRSVNELVAEWGKGSGKDHTCRIALSRVAYLLLCLNSPQHYFSMPPQDEIQTLNVAASSQQAHRAFFKPLRKLLVSSPWFKDKWASGEPPAELASSVRLVKQIELVSGHSMAETQEGLNLIAAIADEISAFKTADELMKKGDRESPKSAEAILNVLRTSASTRFPLNYKLAQISYPRFKGDAIEQAMARGRNHIAKYGEDSHFLVSGPFATWDINPRVGDLPRIEIPGIPIRIPKAPAIIEMYETEPATAKAMYECLPELSPNRFFKNNAALMAAFESIRDQDPVDVEYSWGIDPEDEKAVVPSWQVEFIYAEDFYPLRNVDYAIHGDLAISGDRAGVAMSHVKGWREVPPATPGDAPQMLPIVKVDFVMAFEADPTTVHPETGETAPREVQIRWYRQLIMELVGRGFNIAYVSFDNFQSFDAIQTLTSWGIESGVLSMDKSAVPWQTLRDVMYDGRLEGYHVPLLELELQAITRLPNGKLDHPSGGSKDMADALAGSITGALQFEGDEGDNPVRADRDNVDMSTPDDPRAVEFLMMPSAYQNVGGWDDMGYGETAGVFGR